MTNKAVEMAVGLLYRLGADPREWGVRELGRELGYTKSTVQRLLVTLEGQGLVVSVPGQRYRLGPGVVRLAAPYLQHSDLLSRCRLPMEQLRDQTGETVCLHVRVVHHRVTVHQVESPHELRWSVAIGQPYPLHAGASGKILLAFLPQKEVDAILAATGLPALSPHTITERAALLADLQRIRSDGYAVTYGERLPGGVGLAAPVQNGSGQVVASMSIYGPDSRLTEEKVADYLPLLLQACRSVSQDVAINPPVWPNNAPAWSSNAPV